MTNKTIQQQLQLEQPQKREINLKDLSIVWRTLLEEDTDMLHFYRFRCDELEVPTGYVKVDYGRFFNHTTGKKKGQPNLKNSYGPRYRIFVQTLQLKKLLWYYNFIYSVRYRTMNLYNGVESHSMDFPSAVLRLKRMTRLAFNDKCITYYDNDGPVDGISLLPKEAFVAGDQDIYLGDAIHFLRFYREEMKQIFKEIQSHKLKVVGAGKLT